MDIINSVVTKYQSGMPIKEIASNLKISEVKVRRILITEGLWSSATSEKVLLLHRRGMSAVEIAQELKKPLKTVQAYMPYTRGEYGASEPSDSAKVNKEYREKNRRLADRQVSRRKERIVNIINLEEYKTMAEFIRESRKVMKLHMELAIDATDEQWEILRKYGKCEHGISRDILVPAEMPLHNLNYVIQRAFGWQNSHLHMFSYPKDVFQEVITGFLDDWLSLCGIYYRFPQDEFDDLYWDDDYMGSGSIKSWMRKKYVGPYYYGGEVEHYMYAQTQARMFRQQNPVMRVGATFEEFLAGNTEEKIKKLEEIRVDEIGMYFEMGMDELLERLPVEQVLDVAVSDDWAEEADNIVDEYDDAFGSLYGEMQEIIQETREEYVYSKLKRFYDRTDPVVRPLSDMLLYSYDYGDGWEVEITCSEVYSADDSEAWGELQEQVGVVLEEYRPVCVSADGLPVLDDVGGIGGYCGFLLGVHGKDCGPYAFEDKEETREWGRMHGWNGRMSKPENVV